jgi:hypothetical protein
LSEPNGRDQGRQPDWNFLGADTRHGMNAGRLIEQFQRMGKNAENFKPVIMQRIEQSPKGLDEQ